MRGLSLGTEVVLDDCGRKLHSRQKELSLCEQPRRPGCWIDSIDGRSVLVQSCASKRSACPCRFTAVPGTPRPCSLVSLSIHNTRRSEREKGVGVAQVMSEPTPIVATDVEQTDSEMSKLQKKLAAAEADAAKWSEYCDGRNKKSREEIAVMQKDVMTFINDIVSSSSEKHAEQMEPVKAWAKTCHETACPENTLPLTRLISCASSKINELKRGREAEGEKEAALRLAEEKLEKVEAENAQKEKALAEALSYVQDLTSQKDALYGKLASCGMVSGLEQHAPLQAVASVASANGGGKTSTSAAAEVAPSKTAEPDLMQFISSRASSGSNSHTIRQSGTAHSQLGGSDPLVAELGAIF